jgi:hypothetical protein
MKTTTTPIYSASHSRRVAVIVVVTALALVMSNSIMTIPLPQQSVFALKKFYNCMTDIANKSGKLTTTDITICYDKEYHTGPYFTHKSDSTGVNGMGSIKPSQ